ncbi:MAG TPA: hypothetical protein VNE42_12105 [Acidimicrobiales bacterium]|nr:hypothetical protein [Acidimicrobiales bacterium]
MIDFHQQSSKQTARRFGASVLVATLGLTVGAAPFAFASTSPTPTSHGVSSFQLVLDRSKGAVTLIQLPPVSPDNPLVILPSRVTLSRAQGWLSRAIIIRQTALLSLSNSLTTERMIQAGDRSQLTELIDVAMATLDAIATAASGDTTVATVWRQAEQVMSLQVLNVTVPQVRLLSRVDFWIGLAAQLSAKESSAAAAIAISRPTASSLQSEQTLDQTVKSLAQAITSELQSTQNALLALPGSSDTDAAAFSDAKVALSTATGQLRLANSDLMYLVVQLAGR